MGQMSLRVLFTMLVWSVYLALTHTSVCNSRASRWNTNKSSRSSCQHCNAPTTQQYWTPSNRRLSSHLDWHLAFIHSSTVISPMVFFILPVFSHSSDRFLCSWRTFLFVHLLTTWHWLHSQSIYHLDTYRRTLSGSYFSLSGISASSAVLQLT